MENDNVFHYYSPCTAPDAVYRTKSVYGSLSSLDSQNSEENKNKTVEGHFENRRGHSLNQSYGMRLQARLPKLWNG